VLNLVAIIGLFLSSIAMADIFQQSAFKHRLLIVTTGNDLARGTIRQLLMRSREKLIERKLVVISKENNTAEIIWGDVTIISLLDNQSIQRRLGEHKAVLIGLDSATKAVYDSFDLTQIFADIDGMPMRKSELSM
jgi:hypothetical protein